MEDYASKIVRRGFKRINAKLSNRARTIRRLWEENSRLKALIKFTNEMEASFLTGLRREEE